ncbi:site-specific tyrosine recombinase XerC [Rugamonas sp. FT82W]|uniref:Site-specific tyrosine recombinase XerC n=1 Tax=Duganella vulcania TaxID=2692166 RepID=A0A845G287_9BURK|nr:site-specific tyrosine recombinase XerC [Duganella vulcania]MYM88793.1 site-specific tyrosine recombinase XerC [Duganella vulcania]
MRPTRPGKPPGPLHYAGDPETRGGFRSYLIEFIDWTQAMRYSATTLKNRRIEMGYFIDWCEERGVNTPLDVTRAMLERYRQYIFAYRRKADGAPLSFQTQGKRLITVRMFFKWMAKNHHLLFNPASEMELPRQETRLPRTVAEIAQVLNAADIDDPSGFGIRDRAMLEALYSTGMRRAELVGLDLNDVDAERGTVLVRLGKGKKDRMVPIGERALAWIARYVRDVRPRYLDDDNDPALFLSKHYERVSAKQMSGIAKKTIDRANLDRVQTSGPLNSSCHLFRHACATHMLENGADIRYIQALLGHAELTTTEVYTRVAIVKLKEVHEATHPARLQARGAAQGGVSPLGAADVRAALLDALDAEVTHTDQH